LRSIVLNQFGASVGQSLGSHLVIASTLKLVHAGVGVSAPGGRTASLDAASDLASRRRNARRARHRGDGRAGAREDWRHGPERQQPEFGAGADAFT
jgi:hypothetical protein